MSDPVKSVAAAILKARAPKQSREAWAEVAAREAIVALRDSLTDSMAEVIALHGRCCGGVAHTIWVEACDEALK